MQPERYSKPPPETFHLFPCQPLRRASPLGNPFCFCARATKTPTNGDREVKRAVVLKACIRFGLWTSLSFFARSKWHWSHGIRAVGYAALCFYGFSLSYDNAQSHPYVKLRGLQLLFWLLFCSTSVLRSMYSTETWWGVVFAVVS